MSVFPQPRPSYDALSEEALLSLGSMEGLYQPPAVEARVESLKVAHASPWPGYLLAGAVASAAFAIHYLPFAPFRIAGEHGVRRPISASIIAILCGLLVRNLYPVSSSTVAGCKSIVRRVIPITIILTGAGLNLTHMATVGFTALAITLICIALALGSAWACARWLGLWPKTAILIGAGTAICGTSAIVAVAPLIDAEDEDITLSVGTVNLLGLVLMFLFPLIGGLLHLREEAFGVWAGTSIHAVPQVVAAGFAYGEKAGALATLVKLVRVTLLAPLLFTFMLLYTQRRQREITVHYSRFIPPFVWGFAALALLNTAGLFPALEWRPAAWVFAAGHDFSMPLGPLLVDAGNLLLTVAMAAMGLEVNLRMMARVGARALLAGVISCAVLCGASLALIEVLI